MRNLSVGRSFYKIAFGFKSHDFTYRAVIRQWNFGMSSHEWRQAEACFILCYTLQFIFTVIFKLVARQGIVWSIAGSTPLQRFLSAISSRNIHFCKSSCMFSFNNVLNYSSSLVLYFGNGKAWTKSLELQESDETSCSVYTLVVSIVILVYGNKLSSRLPPLTHQSNYFNLVDEHRIPSLVFSCIYRPF